VFHLGSSIVHCLLRHLQVLCTMGLAPSRNVVPAGRSENCSAPLGSLLVEVDDKGKLTVVEQDSHVMESAWENFLADNNRVLEVLGLAGGRPLQPRAAV